MGRCSAGWFWQSHEVWHVIEAGVEREDWADRPPPHHGNVQSVSRGEARMLRHNRQRRLYIGALDRIDLRDELQQHVHRGTSRLHSADGSESVENLLKHFGARYEGISSQHAFPDG